jgi:3-hydroxyisobutyrate dehydrogenase-like beta-hydroxyacid dehydrogenase
MTEPDSDSTAPKLGCAVVIGTGNMAPGLAAACAIAGLEVVVVGRDPAKANTAAAQASAFARTRVRDPAEIKIAAAT